MNQREAVRQSPPFGVPSRPLIFAAVIALSLFSFSFTASQELNEQETWEYIKRTVRENIDWDAYYAAGGELQKYHISWDNPIFSYEYSLLYEDHPNGTYQSHITIIIDFSDPSVDSTYPEGTGLISFVCPNNCIRRIHYARGRLVSDRRMSETLFISTLGGPVVGRLIRAFRHLASFPVKRGRDPFDP
ncbi:MAG: hypothetical protein E5W90_31685 [Mesorhizobium sp.]|nr:MAG: hypothetical protein E5W90_31685 [Mesorhizobium sp.]